MRKEPDFFSQLGSAEAINLYESTVKNIQQGLIIWHVEDVNDPRSSRIIYANSAAETMTGAAGDDLLSKAVSDFPNWNEM